MIFRSKIKYQFINLKTNLFFVLVENKIQFLRINCTNGYNIRGYVYEKTITMLNRNIPTNWNRLFNVSGQNARGCCSYIRVRKL